MSPQTTVCPDCGNEISRWDEGVCPVCSLGGYSIDERGSLVMYGGDNIADFIRHDSTPIYHPITPKEQTFQKPASSAKNAIQNISKPVLAVSKVTPKEIRAFGFDRLLRDIYSNEITFAEILTKLGVPASKLQNKTRNNMWSLAFLESLEIAVLANLRPVSNCQPKVLLYWYGLDGEYPRSIYKIAGELRISTQQVELSRKSCIQFLKSKEGIRRLEKEILKWSVIDL